MFSTKYWDIFPLLLFLEQMVLQSPDYHFLSFAHLHQTVPPQLGVTGKFASEYFNKFVSCLMQFEDKIFQGSQEK